MAAAAVELYLAVLLLCAEHDGIGGSGTATTLLYVRDGVWTTDVRCGWRRREKPTDVW